MVQVSVLVPSYNYADKIADCIRSVLAQDHPSFELVISDDASTDESDAVIRSFRDPRIVYERQPRNLGMVPNWLRCVELSRGEYLLLLGADDYLKPTMLSRTSRVLDSAKDIAFCHTGAEFFTEIGRVVGVTGAFRRSYVSSGIDVLPKFVRGQRVVNSASLFRRAHFEELGGWSSDYKNCMDQDLWFRMLLRWRVGYIGEVLVGFRSHPTSDGWKLLQAEEDLRFVLSMFDRLPAELSWLRAERDAFAKTVAINSVDALRRLPPSSERDRRLAQLSPYATPDRARSIVRTLVSRLRAQGTTWLANLPAPVRYRVGDWARSISRHG